MYEQKSNLGSILVAVLAIALILGGVFLLNQSFNNNKAKDLSNASVSTSSSLLVVKNSSSTGLLGLDSDSSSSIMNSGDNSSISSLGDFGSTNSSSKSSSKSNSSSKSGSSDSSSSAGISGDLKIGEFTAKAITPTAKGSNWEIIECNVTTVYFCKPGFKFPFSQSGTIGKTYKFSGGNITDTKEGLAVSGVNPAIID